MPVVLPSMTAHDCDLAIAQMQSISLKALQQGAT
jgi:hypothetical protein